MTRRKTVQIIPPLGYREQVIDHSFTSAKGTIKIPDEVETQVQTFLNRKRVSSHDQSAENPHWPVMGQHELESLL